MPASSRGKLLTRWIPEERQSKEWKDKHSWQKVNVHDWDTLLWLTAENSELLKKLTLLLVLTQGFPQAAVNE